MTKQSPQLFSHLLPADLVCFSHLRWNFVYQRPQHLLTRCARTFRVFFIEEPVFHSSDDTFTLTFSSEQVWIVVPTLTGDSNATDVNERLKKIVSEVFESMAIRDFIAWYYTPMALPFTDHLTPMFTIYDCMDELSAFKDAPLELTRNEQRLLDKTDLVFTGGHSLYEFKKDKHHDVHAFPSSIDKTHFEKARVAKHEPADQQHIGHPRIGFFGVIDERLDIELISQTAKQNPECNFILIGPVVKIDESDLPKADNIHYLGSRSYKDLPSYISGWDIAMIPFAINESTKFISPTKTPEYLAAGKPVISTPIRDVVRPYGEQALVEIVDSPEAFSISINKLLETNKSQWLTRTDEFLKHNSWELTWSSMMQLISTKFYQKTSNNNYRPLKTKPTKEEDNVYV